jgi:hypothetical protein
MVAHFHRPGFEYLLALDEPIDTHSPALLIGPIVGCDGNTTDALNAPLNCSAGTGTHETLFPMGARIAACEPLLLNAERARGAKYQFIARTRSDFRYLKPLPALSSLLAPPRRAQLPYDVAFFDDQLAVALRAHAGTVFGNAPLAYSTCANSTSWSVACGRRAAVGRLVPCCPMWLVLSLGRNEGRLEPLRARRCGLVWVGSCGIPRCAIEIVRPFPLPGQVSKRLATACAPRVQNETHVVTRLPPPTSAVANWTRVQCSAGSLTRESAAATVMAASRGGVR